jgi:hypothetical protein
VVVTGGNHWQIHWPPKRRKQAKTVAVDCDQLREAAHGKEGVDGSSPEEGDTWRRFATPSDPHVGKRTIVMGLMKSSSIEDASGWSLVTNHGHVLACIAADSDARLRDIAATVGITERTAAQIVGDLEQAGYLTKTRIGRRNRYQLDGKRRVRAPRRPSMTVAQLLSLLLQAVDQQPFT